MDFELSEDEKAFRDELRAFFAAELTPDVFRRHRDHNEQGMWSVEFTTAFRRRLGERGYIGMGWPGEYGGGGKSPVHQTLFWEEMEYHRAPGLDRSITYVPNALMAFGSPEQQAAFLPRMARGELAWFVGYSEPEAGSDLAGLKTRARADGETFRISGQKAFSSDAHMADYAIVAARTDPDAARHAGITLFLVDMTSPGITVSRYPTLAGWTHHGVYFDDVRVPRSSVLGAVDQGWKVLMGAIDFERAALSSPGLVRYQIDRLIAWCAGAPERGDGPGLADPVVRDTLARLAIEGEGARLMSYWIASLDARGRRPHYETSLALLVKRETARACDEAGTSLLGPLAPLRQGAPGAPFDGAVEIEYRDHLYFQFAAGGFDITRNVVAQRGLGLPRG